jgi:putative ABC transport system permease protein
MTHDIRPRSLIVSYTLGVLLTFGVVTFSAWRVSVLNIVSAIRNLPETEGKRAGVQRIPWLGLVSIVLGVFFAFGGLQSLNATAFWSGVSLIILGFVPVLRSLGAPDRLAYSVCGLVLAAIFLAPFGTFDFILPRFKADMSIWVVAGTMAVLGATWVVMYNSSLLLDGLMKLFGRFRLMAPVVKTAVSRPLANRFRTGMAVAMFSLVVMTLVVMAVITGSMMDSFSKIDDFAGGFDVQGNSLRVNPITDLKGTIAGSGTLRSEQFEAVSSQSIVNLKAHQADTANEAKDFPIRGVDDVFLQRAQFAFALKAADYATDRDVWDALAKNPNLAVINANAVPRRTNLGFAVGLPEFQLQGFYYEDTTFTPLQVEVTDAASGKTRTLTVIAVLRETVSPLTLGLLTSQQGQAATYGDLVVPSLHLFKLAPGVNADTTAKQLETLFLSNGMDASVLHEDMDDMLGSSLTFNYLLQGFMGLGLIVGVAALGVISARSVVERRQQIGVLRAIGFQKGMVELSFLLESSFVALLGIAVGTLLGLIIAWNVISDSASSGHMDIAFNVPWLNLVLIFGAAYAVSLLTTFLPARQASQVYPAEALRYE